MKKIPKVLSLSMMFMAFTLGACNFGNSSWNYNDEEMFNAMELDTFVQLNDKLRITISSDDTFFKSNISKNSILVAPKVSDESLDKVTFEQLKKNRVKEFSFRQIDNKNVVITLDDFSSPAYYIYFDKSASTENKFAQATVSLYSNVDDIEPIFSLDNKSYYSGTSNLKFSIFYNGAEVSENYRTYVEFTDAFSDLSAQNVVIEENLITIQTSGFVGEGEVGNIVLKQGFFANVDRDVTLTGDILYTVAFIDQSTFEFANDTLSFKLNSINLSFKEQLNITNADIVDENKIAQVASFTYIDDKVASISISFSEAQTSVNEVLEYLNGSKITLIDAFSGVDGEFSFNMNVQFPDLNIYAKVSPSEQKLYITVYIRYAESLELTESDISFFESNIFLSGEDKNASVSDFKYLGEGFTMTLDLDKDFDELAYGKLRINLDKIKTLWGEKYSVYESFDSTKLFASDWTDKDLDEVEESILTTSSAHIVHKSILTLGYLGAAITAVTDPQHRNISGCITSFLSIFQVWGFTSAGEPSIGDVLNKLEQINGEVKSLQASLDSMSQTIERELSYIEHGIDSIAYQQYRTNWMQFNKDYIEKMESLIRTNRAKFQKEFVDRMRAIDDVLSLRIYYISEDGVLKTTIVSPKDPYKSVEEKDIKKAHRVRIPKSYLQPVIDEINAYGGYTSKVSELFNGCVDKFLKDNDHLAARVSRDDIVGTFDGDIKTFVDTLEEASEFNNVFINYCNQISGKNFAQQCVLDDYYRMNECYYNFQSELEKPLKTFRSNFLKQLSNYATFDNQIRSFACSEESFEETDEAYQAAYSKIQKSTNIRDTSKGLGYCYITNSVFDNNLVKAKYTVSYDQTNKTLKRSFAFTDYSEGTNVDYVNNDTLISQAKFNNIYRRFLSLKEAGLIEKDKTYVKYMEDYGGLPSDAASVYSSERTASESFGQTLPNASIPIIVSYDGSEFASTASGYKVYCETSLDSSSKYFKTLTKYDYKSAGEKGKAVDSCWSAVEAKGVIIDLATMQPVTDIINRAAVYSESHGGWIHDENFQFTEYHNGMIAYVYFMV